MSLSTLRDVDMRRVLGFPDYVGESFAVFPSYTNDGLDTPRCLITIDKGSTLNGCAAFPRSLA